MNDGGPAFPMGVPDSGCGGPVHAQYGMSLLDYFAGQALVAIFAMEANPRVGQSVEPFNEFGHTKQVAAISYRIAAAMLAERERLNKESTK